MQEVEFLQNLLRLLTDVTFIPFAAAGVIVITNILKMIRVPVNPTLLALLVQVVVWVAYTIARQHGVELRFQEFWDALINVIQAVLPLVGSIAAAHVGYESAKSAGVPLLGYSGNKAELVVG